MSGPHPSKPRLFAVLWLPYACAACGSDTTPTLDLAVDAGAHELDASKGELDASMEDAAAARTEAGSDAPDTSTPSSGEDASVTDASTATDGGAPDGGPDAATYTCTSTTKATSTRCGGAHCQQAPEALRTATPTSATCGADYEVASLCSLEAPGAVAECAVAALFGGPDTKTCAAARLPQVRGTCIDCYVASTDCTRDRCLSSCTTPTASACDTCRIREGCMAAFYTCAGVPSPYP